MPPVTQTTLDGEQLLEVLAGSPPGELSMDAVTSISTVGDVH
jgi:hypothetical protein